MKIDDFAPIALLASAVMLAFAAAMLVCVLVLASPRTVYLRGGCDVSDIGKLKPGYYTVRRP